MKFLTHDCTVRLNTWTHSYATVGTLNGCQWEKGNHVLVTERYVADQYLRGGSECWANTAPTFLSSDKSHYARAREMYDLAEVLEPDEIVNIDGRLFRVCVDKLDRGARPRYSDSIKFKRVDDASLKATIAELIAERAAA